MNSDSAKSNVKSFLNYVTGHKPFRNKLPARSSINKILVISLYFKGDLLFHTTFIEMLKQIFPKAKLDLWIKDRVADVISDDLRFNEIIVFNDIKTAIYRESTKINFKGKLILLKTLRQRKYDLIFDLTGKYSTGLFTLLSRPQYSIGINYNFFGFCYDRFVNLNTSTESGHLIEKYLRIIPVGLDLNDKEWEKLTSGIQLRPYLFINSSVKLLVDELYEKVMIHKSGPLIVMHSTSGWKAKELNASIFAELVKYFNSKNYNFVFIGDDKDEEKVTQIKSYLEISDFTDNRNFLKLKFIQTVELIRRSDLFIGSDSAPLHAAGAVGTPSIGIFGPTNPDFSRPIGSIHKVIYHRLFCSASENKQYCTRNAGMSCPTVDCMKMVTADEIIETIEKILIHRI